jgi:hypothetical protein
MADNFLEKHYDDYEHRKELWQKRQSLYKAKALLAKIKKEQNQ